MKRRLAVLIAAAGIAAASVVAAPAAQAQDQEQAYQQCEKALQDAQAQNGGVCFWTEEYWEGQIDVHADPAPPSVCGTLNTPAKSAVNLTNDDRLLYKYSNCNGFLRILPAGEAESGYAPYGVASWR